MKKHDLANQLRQRQYKLGKVQRRTIDALSDDIIIDCYVTCSDCGEKFIEGESLQKAIESAADVDSFLDICDGIVRAKDILKRGVQQRKET